MGNALLSDPNLTPLCWDCQEPLTEEAVRVKVHPGVPWSVSKSTTSVCPPCAAKRGEADRG